MNRLLSFLSPLRSLPVAIVYLALSLLLMIGLSRKVRLETNTLSRFITVESLVERSTFCVDSSVYKLPIDIIQINGKKYSDKPPLYSLVMATEAKVLAVISGKIPSRNSILYEKFLVLMNQILPYLFLLLLALQLMAKAGFNSGEQVFGLLALGIGILPFSYSIVIINHTPTAVWLFLVFYTLAKSYLLGEVMKTSHMIVAGFFCGMAAAYEIYSLSFALSFAALLFFSEERWNSVLRFGIGFIPVILFAAFLNYSISGSMLPFYTNQSFFHYQGSYWNSPHDFDAYNESWWLYFFNIIVGHHGLISISPILIFGIASVVSVLKRRDRTSIFILANAFAIFLTIFLILIFTNNYGGQSIGLRFFVFFMPVLMFMGLLFLHQIQNKFMKLLSWLLLAFSSITVVEGLLMDPSAMRSSLDLFIHSS